MAEKQSTHMKECLEKNDRTMAEVEARDAQFRAAWRSLSEQSKKEGSLTTKTKELICVALGVMAHCDFCIASHVRHALDEGATRDEIIEAAQVAVLMNGGPAVSYLRYVFDACDEFGA